MLQSKARLLLLNQRLAETLTSKGVEATADETTTALINKVANISGSDKLVEFSQVRSEVQNYLDNVTYDPTDYTTSQIADYVAGTSNNQPDGCKINLKSAGTLIVYDSSSGGSAVTNSVEGDNYIYNLTPNAICHFVNIVDGSNIEQSGTLKATGQMRMIKSASAPNVRDLGGWQCDGGTVNYGKLFRGGEVSSDDAPVLVDYLKIKHDINLRGKSEATWTVSPLGEKVKFHVYDTYAWYAISNTALLKSILTDIFDCVSNDEPAYFHCASGADRTGTIALIVLALLGVSQSDIDKDYELTCFYTGVATDAKARRRNESEWTGLVNAINNYSGDTFRDKVANYLVSAGVSINDINAFRHSMINGTPDDLTAEQVTVTNNLTNATTSNTAISADKSSNYTATITATDGYTLTGATVTVTMGGTDITSSAYADGVINIDNVTDDIVITVVAAEDITMVNKMTVKSLNMRLNSSGAEATGNGCFVCEPIEVDLTKSQPVIFKGFANTMGVISTSDSDPSYGSSMVALLDEAQNLITHYFIGRKNQAKVWYCPVSDTDCVGDLTDLLSVAGYNGTTPTASAVKYVKFAPSLHPSAQGAITTDDLVGLEIQMREN